MRDEKPWMNHPIWMAVLSLFIATFLIVGVGYLRHANDLPERFVEGIAIGIGAWLYFFLSNRKSK